MVLCDMPLGDSVSCLRLIKEIIWQVTRQGFNGVNRRYLDCWLCWSNEQGRIVRNWRCRDRILSPTVSLPTWQPSADRERPPESNEHCCSRMKKYVKWHQSCILYGILSIDVHICVVWALTAVPATPFRLCVHVTGCTLWSAIPWPASYYLNRMTGLSQGVGERHLERLTRRQNLQHRNGKRRDCKR